MNNDLNKGGHLSSQPMGSLTSTWWKKNPATGKDERRQYPCYGRIIPIKLDLDRLAAVLQDYRPELVVFGKSMFIYQEPVKFVYDLVKDWPDRPVLMYDMAHVLGLYGAFQAPLAEGRPDYRQQPIKLSLAPSAAWWPEIFRTAAPSSSSGPIFRDGLFPGQLPTTTWNAAGPVASAFE